MKNLPSGPSEPPPRTEGTVRGRCSEQGSRPRTPWGVRVPPGAPWPYGRHLFAKRCMALLLDGTALPDDPPGVRIRPARPEDLATYAAIDATVFGADDPAATESFLRPMVGADGFHLVLAEVDGEPAGVGYGVRSSGAGGESVGVHGVGVLPAARRRGVGTAITAAVLRWAVSTGADLAWLNPDTDEAASLYARLGFEETEGSDVYVDL